MHHAFFLSLSLLKGNLKRRVYGFQTYRVPSQIDPHAVWALLTVICTVHIGLTLPDFTYKYTEYNH